MKGDPSTQKQMRLKKLENLLQSEVLIYNVSLLIVNNFLEHSL